jgi:hypothetical protein
VRLARSGPLFLEQYLDEPIEAAAGRALGVCAPRNAVAEIGNLASEDGAASTQLFLALADHLDRAGCAFAVVTATQRLKRKLRRLGFVAAVLAPALPARVANVSDWGLYYACAPEVLVGAIAPALEILRGRRSFACVEAAA